MTDISEIARLPEQLSASLELTQEVRNELQASPATALAESFIVDSPLMAQEAADEMNSCKRQRTKVKTLYDGFIKPLDALYEHAKTIFKPRLDDLDAAEGIYKRKLLYWQTQERNRIAAENAARAEEERKARQKAEQEAAQLRAKAEEEARQKAEKARAEAMAKYKAEAEAKEAAAARQRAIDEGNIAAEKEAYQRQRKAEAESRERAAAEAKALEQEQAALENGAAKAAQVQMEAAAVVATVETAKTIAGFGSRENFVAELIDTEDQAKAMIAAACATRPELLAFLKLDMTAINRAAKTYKKALNVPGFKAIDKPIASGKTK